MLDLVVEIPHCRMTAKLLVQSAGRLGAGYGYENVVKYSPANTECTAVGVALGQHRSLNDVRTMCITMS